MPFLRFAFSISFEKANFLHFNISSISSSNYHSRRHIQKIYCSLSYFWAADPKGTMSYRTREEFPSVHPYVGTFVHLNICPSRPLEGSIPLPQSEARKDPSLLSPPAPQTPSSGPSPLAPGSQPPRPEFYGRLSSLYPLPYFELAK